MEEGIETPPLTVRQRSLLDISIPLAAAMVARDGTEDLAATAEEAVELAWLLVKRVKHPAYNSTNR